MYIQKQKTCFQKTKINSRLAVFFVFANKKNAIIAKMEKQNNFFEQVYEIVKQIPKGSVATYGQIAFLMGRPHAAKFVGFALHTNPQPLVVPCHRVVNRQGYLAKAFVFGGINQQKILLEQEGVKVNQTNCVDLQKYQWKH